MILVYFIRQALATVNRTEKSQEIYVMVFQALQEAEDRRKENDR